MKEAVLIINLGTPETPSTAGVKKYLTQFLNDKRVIDINVIARFILVNFFIVPFRSFNSSKLYKSIWTINGSPLLLNSQALKDKLQNHLGKKIHIELAMRYGKPSIKKALENIRKINPSKIHVLPLYPQYASSSTGSTLEEVLNQIKNWEVIPNLNVVSNFFNHPAFIKALLFKAKKYNHENFDHTVFSYHGLPERQIVKASNHYGKNSCGLNSCCDNITNDNSFCYRANCFATSRNLAEALKIPEGKFTTSFQSRLNDNWLKPFSDIVIKDLALSGKKNILVFSPAFVADCLETIYEIEKEYLLLFKKHGGENIQMVESLNDSEEWVKAIKEILKIEAESNS